MGSRHQDTLFCPLCEGDNHCAVTAGAPVDTCWCRQASIDGAALAALPAAERGRRCICPACAGATRSGPGPDSRAPTTTGSDT